MVMGVILKISDVETEDVTWLRKKDECNLINVAEIHAMLKVINLAKILKSRLIQLPCLGR